MPAAEPGPEWVLLSTGAGTRAKTALDHELVEAARSAWPKVLAHARKELLRHGIHSDETGLVTEVWEGVLQSVSKTRQRHNGKGAEILDLEAYLFGAFHHRFNRALKKERRRQATIELVASSHDLEQLPGAQDLKSSRDLEHSIQVKEVVQNMDGWTRKVWTARQYGYSWREIAEHVGLGEQAAKVRFHHALRRLAARLGYGK